jgi:membrane fusion protein (multidrug efflux system)
MSPGLKPAVLATRSPLNRRQLRFLPLSHLSRLALAAAVCLLASCGKPAPPASGPPEVGVVTLQPQTAELKTELPGRTSAIETSEVRPQVSGIVQARLFTEGATVKQGQLLYRIDSSVYRAALAQAQGQLANTRAAVTAAKLRSERYADLVKINAVSKQDADDARAAAEQAAAAVAQAEAAVQSARINLDYTGIKAPISGRIGRSAVTAGALVTANQADALTTIQRLDSVYVDISQSSSDLLALRRALQTGQVSPGAVSVRLKLDDGSDYDQLGRLQFTDVTVDQATGSVTLRAIFPNPRDVLLPGMFVRAVITEAVQQRAILAPQIGVTRDERGLPTAMVVDAAGKAQQRTLKLGRAVGDKWLVQEGLSAGDRLIVEGLQRVRPDSPVRAVPAGSAPAKR